MNKCPLCQKEDCLRDVVFKHAESYGGGTSHLPCVHCKGIIQVTTKVVVQVTSILPSNKPRQECDW